MSRHVVGLITPPFAAIRGGFSRAMNAKQGGRDTPAQTPSETTPTKDARCARCGYDPTYIDSEGYAVQEHECAPEEAEP